MQDERQVLAAALVHEKSVSLSSRLFRKAIVLTRPPLRAKARTSPTKAAASEEVRRTFRYVELLSDARTPLEDFFNIC